MTAARQKVAGALMGAMVLGDAGAQIRYLAAIGHAFVQMGSYDDSLGYFDKALKIAASTPDTGYPFLVNEEGYRHSGVWGTSMPQSSSPTRSSPRPAQDKNMSRKLKL